MAGASRLRLCQCSKKSLRIHLQPSSKGNINPKDCFFEIDIEKFKFEELLSMSGKDILQGLAGDIVGDLEELGNGLLTRFMEEDEGYEELKAYVIEWFNEKLRERISTVYNLEDNEDE